ncbi:HYDIN protein, partial [Climacteris rufus]|nr:HYDIN protein [Climacteris rufus]
RFQVIFDSTKQPLGVVEVLLPIKVPQLLVQAVGWARQEMSPGLSAEFSVLLQAEKGPTSHIRLRATVVPLMLSLSKNRVQFSDTLVGQCQLETIRLFNWLLVPCTWSIAVSRPVPKVQHSHH